MNTEYDDFEKILKTDLRGYHCTIQFYPSGGLIDVTGCEECGTDDGIFIASAWRADKGETLSTAIAKAKQKLQQSGD